MIALSLFIFPSERPQVFWWKKKGSKPRSVPAVLDWPTVQRTYPWGVLLLLGGGFTLAHVCQVFNGIFLTLNDQDLSDHLNNHGRTFR